MTQTNSSHNKSNAPKPSNSNLNNLKNDDDETINRIENSFKNFAKGLSNVFKDITALEVNTMVVSNITGAKFNPLKAYKLIYGLKDEDQSKNNKNKPDQHKINKTVERLHEQLEMAYQQYCLKLKSEAPLQAASFPETLPNPNSEEGLNQVLQLLENSKFLLTLRKLKEVYALLEGEDAAEANLNDIISAQTVIQIDGDILNRFHKYLLDTNDSERKFLLNIHQQAVIAGEENWRELLKFIKELMEGIVSYFKKDKWFR
jgi:hypothetical protein